MNHETTTFARWRWTPRTAQSATEAAYAIERFPGAKPQQQTNPIASFALGIVLGIMGAALLAHWWAQ